MQRNWIGRSEGARVKFALEGRSGDADRGLHDAHRHDLRRDVRAARRPSIRSSATLAERSTDPAAFRQQVQAFRAQDRAARISGEIEKQGFDTGFRAINPFTKQPVPVWVANFVLGEYGTGAVMAVPAHDQRDFEFARKFDLPIRVVVTPDGKPARRRRHDRGGRGVRHARRLGRVLGPAVGRRAEADDCGREGARHRRGDGSVPAEGLGHLAPALLGHADSDDLLREGRHRAGAGRPAAGGAAEDRAVHRPRRLAAGAGAGVRQRHVSEVRRSGAARDRHDGHVRRLVLVLLPLRRSAERRACRSIRRR